MSYSKCESGMAGRGSSAICSASYSVGMNEGPACGSDPRCVLGLGLSSSMVISLVVHLCWFNFPGGLCRHIPYVCLLDSTMALLVGIVQHNMGVHYLSHIIIVALFCTFNKQFKAIQCLTPGENNT